MFLNARRYTQRVLGGTWKATPFNVDRLPTVFKVLTWFYGVNMVTNAIASKTLSVKLNYFYVNIIGLVEHRAFEAWATLFLCVSN